MNTVYFYLFLAVLVHTIGIIIFGHFEEKTPLNRRLFKVVIMIVGTAIGYQFIGGIGAIVFSFGLIGLGLTVHVMWCRKHNIHPLTAEPKARYYKLRGWN